jgi:hypothetical protein
MTNGDPTKLHKESFVRWQGTTIQQLGYSINLVLAIATASLGFAVNLLKDSDFHTYCGGKTLLSLSLLLFYCPSVWELCARLTGCAISGRRPALLAIGSNGEETVFRRRKLTDTFQSAAQKPDGSGRERGVYFTGKLAPSCLVCRC